MPALRVVLLGAALLPDGGAPLTADAAVSAAAASHAAALVRHLARTHPRLPTRGSRIVVAAAADAARRHVAAE